MQRILIIGANGVLGRAATKHFLKSGMQVKCFVRTRDKASELEKAGASVVEGNLTDNDSLKKACEDVDIVITAAHALLGRGKNNSMSIDNKAHKALIDAAAKENVSHFIYTSVHGVSATHPIDFYRNKFSVEQYLEKSGLNYTILRFPAFMEWHVHNLLGKSLIEKNKVIILGKGENPINFIAVDDVVQALSICAGNKDYFGKVLDVGGPQNISRNAIAAAYAKALGTMPKVIHMPAGILNIMARLITPFHPGIGRVLKFSVYTDKSDETMNINESIRQFGLKPTAVEDFIKRQVPKVS